MLGRKTETLVASAPPLPSDLCLCYSPAMTDPELSDGVKIPIVYVDDEVTENDL